MRWWHLRRGVPWPAVLGCCAVAVVLALLTAARPGIAAATLPLGLAACAAAAGFLLDEVATPVVAVTPRADRWRPASRQALLVLPVATWSAVVLQLPETTREEASGWLLAGTSACLLTAGAASVASRAGTPRPGAGLATALVPITMAPVVLGPLLGLSSPYPFDGLEPWARWFWTLAGLLGAALLSHPWWGARRRAVVRG